MDRGKDVRQGCILSPYMLNLYVEHIQKTGVASEEGLKIGRIAIT